MKTKINIIFSLLILFGSNVYILKGNMPYETESFIKKIASTDTSAMPKPVPEELLIKLPVNDSDVVVFKSGCVVQTEYSESELAAIENKLMSSAGWKTYYEDYLADNDVTMFLYERAMVYVESSKKYIQFITDNGENITIDRKNSVRRLFFFNPATGVKQCLSQDFRREKYKPF